MSADKQCFCCNRPVREPYIKCAECVATAVCTTCFAKGAERRPHQNWHSYSVMTDQIPVLEDSWTAREERHLLDLVATCGYGNWGDISRKLRRSPEECKEHYDSHHLINEEAKLLPAALPPHLLKLTTDQPPRMISHLSGSFNSLRSEVWPEFDTGSAELDLAQCASPADCAECDSSMLDISEALQETMVRIYNDRLRERTKKHQVIRNHGLIQRYYNFQRKYSSLSPFATLLTGYQMDFLLAGLSRAEELRVKFSDLCEIRAHGVKTRRAAAMMKKLSALRAEQGKNMKAWAPMKTDPKCLGKREMRPLQVTGLPLSERLSAEERELCAQARLVPESFFQFKQILISECNKQNGIKLAHARKVIKIDVNKTRKLFDFLMTAGVIHPPTED